MQITKANAKLSTYSARFPCVLEYPAMHILASCFRLAVERLRQPTALSRYAKNLRWILAPCGRKEMDYFGFKASVVTFVQLHHINSSISAFYFSVNLLHYIVHTRISVRCRGTIACTILYTNSHMAVNKITKQILKKNPELVFSAIIFDIKKL